MYLPQSFQWYDKQSSTVLSTQKSSCIEVITHDNSGWLNLPEIAWENETTGKPQNHICQKFIDTLIKGWVSVSAC